MKRTKDSRVAATWWLKLQRGKLLQSAAELKEDLAAGKGTAEEREAVARLVVGLEREVVEIEQELRQVEQDKMVE